jgi:hypothetical protein
MYPAASALAEVFAAFTLSPPRAGAGTRRALHAAAAYTPPADFNAYWMTYLWNRGSPASSGPTRTPLARRAIRDVFLPGTHDSISNNLDKSHPLAAGCPAGVVRDALQAGNAEVAAAVAAWSRAQTRTARDQILAGARYLDLRVAYGAGAKGTGFYFHHCLMSKAAAGEVLENIATLVAQFAKAGKKEVVVLHFYHFDADGAAWNTALHRAFMQSVLDAVARAGAAAALPAGAGAVDYLVARGVRPTSTMGQIAAWKAPGQAAQAHAKLVLLYNDDAGGGFNGPPSWAALGAPARAFVRQSTFLKRVWPQQTTAAGLLAFNSR